METLTISNIKPGLVIVNNDHPEWGNYRVLRKYSEGIWEISAPHGERVLNEHEFKFWSVQ